MNKDPLSKRVQELSTGGDEPPPRFSVTDQSNHSSIPFAEIPIINLSLLSAGSQEELINLRSALTSWGCFQAVGHGISSSLLNDMRDQLKQFFSLPMEEKNKCSRQLGNGASPEGYGNDHVYSEKQILDWVIELFSRCSQKIKEISISGLILQLLFVFYPEQYSPVQENESHLKEVVHGYTLEIEAMINFMLRAIARSLNIGEESFITQFGEQTNMLGRFVLYPVCPKPDKVLGAKAHSDSSGITVILPDTDVPGLQVLKDEKWFMVPIIPEAFFVNLGDQMQIMSNGILKSPLHRVAVNSEQERISTVTFYFPGEETEIGPIQELISDTQPRIYRNVSNYRAINMKAYQSGNIPLDSLKI